MTPKQRRTRGLVALLLLLVLLGVGWFALSLRTPVPSPKETVPVVWADARTMPMHVQHVDHGIACETCHVQGFEQKPSLEVCASCHADPARLAHHGSERTPTACTTCHQFSPRSPVVACATCHTQASAVTTPLAHHASPEAACTTCHAMHTGAPANRATCMGCHQTVAAVHGGWRADADAGAASAVACNGCHAPHQGAAAARQACVGCHVTQSVQDAGAGWAASLAAPRIVPKQPAGHADCTTCHGGHTATKALVAACDSCHADRRNAAQVAGHAACVSCHAPHAPGEPERTCRTCHQQATLGASHVQQHERCTSCHDPHRTTPKLLVGKAGEAAGPCQTCHADVKPSHPVASGPAAACRGCHTPHSASGASVNACSSCHRTPSTHGDRAFHAAGKTACTDCHAAHRFDLHDAAPALCATCHREPAAQVRKGHQNCEGCHGKAHTVAKDPGCQSCHANEVHSAPKGHARCQQCHDSHSGDLGSHRECKSCHAAVAHTPHGQLAGGCAGCHQPHAGAKGAAAPPACTSCHAPQKLPGLHSIPQHAGNCTSCHGGHDAPRADRKTCTSNCHVDRRTHQPEASTCKGCHLFTR